MANSLRRDIDLLKEKLTERRAKHDVFKRKIDNLTRYTTAMSEGYVSSLNVIIDISSILEAYKTLMEELIKIVKETDLSVESLGDLSLLTKEKLAEVQKFFYERHDKLKALVAETAPDKIKSESLRNLEQIKDRFTVAAKVGQELGSQNGGQIAKLKQNLHKNS